MAEEGDDAPLVRLAPSGERRERSGAGAALEWALEPKRRYLLLAAGGLGLFGLGTWTGKAVERRFSQRVSEEAAPALGRPVATLGAPRRSRSSLPQPGSPAPAPPAAGARRPAHFSGVWVVPEGGTEGTDLGPATGGDAQRREPDPVGEGGREQAQVRRQALIPKTFDETQGARGAPAVPAAFGRTGAAAARDGERAKGSGEGGRGEGAHAPAPLRPIPAVGKSVDAKRTKQAVGAAGDDGRFATQGAGGPTLMTTEAGVAPIAIDAAKSFQIREGGPHDPAAGHHSIGSDADGPVKVDLGGKDGGTKP